MGQRYEFILGATVTLAPNNLHMSSWHPALKPIPQVSARRNKIKSELEIYQGIHQARELQNKKNRHINATITDTLSPRIVVDRIIPIRHTYGVAQQAQAADLQPPTQMKAYKLSTLSL